MRCDQLPDKTLNLKGVHCPLNYVKTKLALEMINLGQILEVIVDEGEPSRNVPKSVVNDGHVILNTDKDNEDLVHIIIKKTTEY